MSHDTKHLQMIGDEAEGERDGNLEEETDGGQCIGRQCREAEATDDGRCVRIKGTLRTIVGQGDQHMHP